jgi:hypothetical protein
LGKYEDERFETIRNLASFFGPQTETKIEREVRTQARQLLIDPYLRLFSPGGLEMIDRVLGDNPGWTMYNIPSTRDRVALAIGSYKSDCQSDRPSRAEMLRIFKRISKTAKKLQSDLRKISGGLAPDPLGRDHLERITQECDFEENLDSICAWANVAIPAQKRINSRSGREPDWAWNKLMSSLAHLHRHGPANCEPKVYVNHSRSAGYDEEYGGDFYSLCELVDKAAAEAVGKAHLEPSALYHRLERLLESMRLQSKST